MRSISLQSVLKKLSLIEENQTSLKNNLKVLNDENAKRVEEIKILARQGNALLTEDDDTEKNSSEENSKARESFERRECSNSEYSEDRGGIPVTSHRGPIATVAITAKDLVRAFGKMQTLSLHSTCKPDFITSLWKKNQKDSPRFQHRKGILSSKECHSFLKIPQRLSKG